MIFIINTVQYELFAGRYFYHKACKRTYLRPKNSANEIAFQLESGKTNDAKNSLASEHLTLSPREFRTLINDLELRTKATKAPDVYTQDKGGVFEVFINDTYLTILASFIRGAKP